MAIRIKKEFYSSHPGNDDSSSIRHGDASYFADTSVSVYDICIRNKQTLTANGEKIANNAKLDFEYNLQNGQWKGDHHFHVVGNITYSGTKGAADKFIRHAPLALFDKITLLDNGKEVFQFRDKDIVFLHMLNSSPEDQDVDAAKTNGVLWGSPVDRNAAIGTGSGSGFEIDWMIPMRFLPWNGIMASYLRPSSKNQLTLRIECSDISDIFDATNINTIQWGTVSTTELVIDSFEIPDYQYDMVLSDRFSSSDSVLHMYHNLHTIRKAATGSAGVKYSMDLGQIKDVSDGLVVSVIADSDDVTTAAKDPYNFVNDTVIQSLQLYDANVPFTYLETYSDYAQRKWIGTNFEEKKIEYQVRPSQQLIIPFGISNPQSRVYGTSVSLSEMTEFTLEITPKTGIAMDNYTVYVSSLSRKAYHETRNQYLMSNA